MARRFLFAVALAIAERLGHLSTQNQTALVGTKASCLIAVATVIRRRLSDFAHGEARRLTDGLTLENAVPMDLSIGGIN